jgi:glycosyltransferase involved in cell wall biosynthesis
VTWLGHSTTLLEIDGQRVLFDPVWSDRASPVPLFGGKAFYPLPLPLAELPPVAVVLISHDHFDHLDMPTVKALAARGARFVVLYSGNMGRAHDVSTMVGAARRLADRADIAFVFLGQGNKRAELELGTRGLPNVRFAPYQSRERLAESLSAADVHLITLSPNVLGLLEPSKLYGVMAAGRPALFVGPAESEVARTIEREGCGRVFPNGDARGLAAAIASLAGDAPTRDHMGRRGRDALVARYDRRVATSSFRELLLGLAGPDPA